MLSNRSLLEKADLALADLTGDGGLLQPAQAARFIRLVIKRSVLLPRVQIVPMNSPKRLLETLRFAGRVLRPGNPATALPVGDRVKPDLTKRELDAKEYKAEARLNDHVLEDNIERGGLKNTVMQALAEAVSRDVEFAVWNGDTLSADTLLAVQDGVLKLITTNTFDHLANPTNNDLWIKMLKKLPSEFLIRSRLGFFTSVKSELDWRASVSERQTQMGDANLSADTLIRPQGIPLLGIPEAREDVPGADKTTAVLTDPKNIAVGFQRDIRIETDRDISAGELIVVVTLRMAVQLVHEPAAVKATNIDVTP